MNSNDPASPAEPNPPVDMVVVPRSSDLGDGFVVRRALPSPRRRMVGPFVFFDQMGPVVLRDGRALDVRPHPHIGLATVTYLFDGEILHRDSLGSVQPIRPGELNWMTAGRGIAHSERTPPELRGATSSVYGIQTWIALPAKDEEISPSFVHHAAGELPVLEGDGARARVILGTLQGARSPVVTRTETFYADVVLQPGAVFEMPAAREYEERAAYLLEGAVEILPSEQRFEPGRLLVFARGEQVTLRAVDGVARLMLLGGAAMDGPRHVWWNFVSSSPERIEQAKSDWKNGRFGAIPGETEFIPLPDDAPRPVKYP